jgi:hypothetical protein
MAENSQPAPRSAGARKLVLEVTLYEGGHSVVNTTPRTPSVLSNNDAELVAQFASIIHNLRGQLQ